jgi:hypothetical protein
VPAWERKRARLLGLIVDHGDDNDYIEVVRPRQQGDSG